MTPRKWVDQVADEGLELMTADGYDDCIVGIAQQFNRDFVVYDREKVLAKLMTDGMSREEAEEYFEFNIVGAYVGESTPAFITFVPKE